MPSDLRVRYIIDRHTDVPVPESVACCCLVSKIMSRLRLVATNRPYPASITVSWYVFPKGAPRSPVTLRFWQSDHVVISTAQKKKHAGNVTSEHGLLFWFGLPSPGEERCAHNGKQRDLDKRVAHWLEIKWTKVLIKHIGQSFDKIHSLYLLLPFLKFLLLLLFRWDLYWGCGPFGVGALSNYCFPFL